VATFTHSETTLSEDVNSQRSAAHNETNSSRFPLSHTPSQMKISEDQTSPRSTPVYKYPDCPLVQFYRTVEQGHNDNTRHSSRIERNTLTSVHTKPAMPRLHATLTTSVLPTDELILNDALPSPNRASPWFQRQTISLSQNAVYTTCGPLNGMKLVHSTPASPPHSHDHRYDVSASGMALKHGLNASTLPQQSWIEDRSQGQQFSTDGPPVQSSPSLALTPAMDIHSTWTTLPEPGHLKHTGFVPSLDNRAQIFHSALTSPCRSLDLCRPECTANRNTSTQVVGVTLRDSQIPTSSFESTRTHFQPLELRRKELNRFYEEGGPSNQTGNVRTTSKSL
jgi:hypothetical protein